MKEKRMIDPERYEEKVLCFPGIWRGMAIISFLAQRHEEHGRSRAPAVDGAFLLGKGMGYKILDV